MSRLEPEWAAAAAVVKEQTQGKVKLASVDATVHRMLASRYEVCGWGGVATLSSLHLLKCICIISLMCNERLILLLIP